MINLTNMKIYNWCTVCDGLFVQFEQDPGYKSALAAQRVEHEYRNLGKMLEGLTDGISMGKY